MTRQCRLSRYGYLLALILVDPPGVGMESRDLLCPEITFKSPWLLLCDLGCDLFAGTTWVDASLCRCAVCAWTYLFSSFCARFPLHLSSRDRRRADCSSSIPDCICNISCVFVRGCQWMSEKVSAGEERREEERSRAPVRERELGIRREGQR